MKTEKGETIALIISIFVAIALVALFAFAYSSMQKEWYEGVKNSTERKAYCDSVGGRLGGNKCFVNGEEVKPRGEE